MTSRYERLDKILVQRGLAPSREKAQGLILAGCVRVDGHCVTQCGRKIPENADIQVQGQDHPYVSRGGVKLAHALDHFGLNVAGLVIMDVGASTGGFTDCLLQRGAGKVYAVDVGYGQLAWKLRQDPRVIVLERSNIRYLDRSAIPESVDGAVIDVSFISLKLVLPKVLTFLKPEAFLVALIKPQFEAGREHVGKGGVVKDASVHEAVCRAVAETVQSLECQVLGIIPSPILGPKGNREFLLAARYARDDRTPSPDTGLSPAHRL
ncbi:MAG: TlyA family RNA methyltransferase [Desulfosoma sp.]|uniref:TlyA family RNA methyltransferase n=1 Tax=Desulfosoma sp. TaxID=2603217 RepID=UPI0040492DBE